MMYNTPQDSIEDAQDDAPILDPLEYAAFKVGGGDAGRRVLALEIRTREPFWPTPFYNGLLYTMEDGEKGTFLALVFSSMQIYVKGRNLRPVAAAVKRHRCSALWEFDAERWLLPADKSAPFIASITLHLPMHSQQAIAEAQGVADK